MNPTAATRTIRFALGTTLSLAFAFGLDYPLAVVTPVLTSVLLGSAAPRPGPGAMAGIVVAAIVGLGIGVLVSLSVLGSPPLLLLGVGLLVFRIYLAAAGGAPAFLVLMLLIGVLLVPIVGIGSLQGALDFTGDFVFALLLALAWVQVAHAILPDGAPDGSPAAPVRAPGMRARSIYALERTLIVLPAFAILVTLQLTAGLQALLYAAILSLGAQPGGGLRASLPMLGGAVLGGAFAIVIYLLTSMVHEFPLLLLLVFFSLLVIGRRVFSGGPATPYWSSAKSAMLILIASTDSVVGDETGGKLFARVGAILLAGALLALGLRISASFLGARSGRGFAHAGLG